MASFLASSARSYAAFGKPTAKLAAITPCNYFPTGISAAGSSPLYQPSKLNQRYHPDHYTNDLNLLCFDRIEACTFLVRFGLAWAGLRLRLGLIQRNEVILVPTRSFAACHALNEATK